MQTEAKVEDGRLYVEWYRRGGEVVFRETVWLDAEADMRRLVEVIGRLQDRIAALESRLAATS